MASDRSERAAARVVTAAVRAEELRNRLARLRAGELSTQEDVELARASAARQRAEAVRAQQRLLRAYAAAADVHRPALGPPRADVSRRPVPDTSGGTRTLSEQNSVLRRALVSIGAASGGAAAWSTDRRQQLWQNLTDQCSQASWQGWSHALCMTARSMLPGVRGVALSGYDGEGVPHLLAVTDDWTRQVEEIAQLVGEGPAVEAFRAQRPVLVRRLSDEEARWPGYVEAAAGTGLTTICALPVELDGVALGSLTLYPADRDDSSWRAWPDGLYLTAVAARALLADLDALDEGWLLGDVGDDRVQMATGVLSVQLNVSVSEASVLLRAFAFSGARRLVEVADAVLDGSLRIA